MAHGHGSTANGKEGTSNDKNGNHSFATKGLGNIEENNNVNESEDVFEDEEMSSSECNSEDSGYSHQDNGDLFS